MELSKLHNVGGNVLLFTACAVFCGEQDRLYKEIHIHQVAIKGINLGLALAVCDANVRKIFKQLRHSMTRLDSESNFHRSRYL